MKLLLSMLAAGLLCAPLMAQGATCEPKVGTKVVVLGEEGEDCPECEGIEIEEVDIDKALEEVLKDEKLPQEVREALRKMFEKLKDLSKDKGGDVDETTEETLPDGTKVKVRTVRKTSSGGDLDDSDLPEEIRDELKKLREEMEKLKEEIDKKIEDQLGGGDGEAEETIEKTLPDGTKVKIVKKVVRKTSGEAPKAPEPPKSEDKPNKQ